MRHHRHHPLYARDFFLAAIVTRLLAAIGFGGLLRRLALALAAAVVAIVAAGPLWGAAVASVAVMAAVVAWAAT